MRAALAYTALRLGSFAIIAGIAYLLGLRGFLLVIVALVVSLPISLVLLRRPRAAMARQIADGLERRRRDRARVRDDLRGDQRDQ
ncbi:MAG: DUF4229 domain-containing protein [Mycobacteriales bacterium]